MAVPRPRGSRLNERAGESPTLRDHRPPLGFWMALRGRHAASLFERMKTTGFGAVARTWAAGMMLWVVVGDPVLGAVPGRFRFKEPSETEYEVVGNLEAHAAGGGLEWVEATRPGPGGGRVTLGRRIVIGVEPGIDVGALMVGRGLEKVRVGPGQLEIWQGQDALSVAGAAMALAGEPGVRVACPVMRRDWVLQTPYASRPKDPLYPRQWHLENRLGTGRSRGPDLNVRAAWPVARGAGVVVGIADNGVEVAHPDLLGRTTGQPHFDFDASEVRGLGTAPGDHGTAVAGLVAATPDNNRGVTGVAPAAGLASMVIFADNGDGGESIVPDDALAEVFRYRPDDVWVQNHSWGIGSARQVFRDPLSDAAIEEAVTGGRGGRGTVIVRAAGNGRAELLNANDDGFSSDPRVISVGAVRMDGRATAYSEPGANLLVAAPSGDPRADGSEDLTSPNLPTTDRRGTAGYNWVVGDSGDYGSGDSGFNGTSASTPLVSGAVALVLSARPQLSVRDVQQLLVLSSRHWDLTDPDMVTNAAGLRVSHSLGFGVPDCGLAVELARRWEPRPPVQRVVVTARPASSIPDDTCRLVIEGTPLLPSNLRSIRVLPGMGVFPDAGMASAPLQYVGRGNTNLPATLAGRVALIAEGTNTEADKVTRAAKAGAVAAVIFRNAGDTAIDVMPGTSLVPIPAFQMAQATGETLSRVLGTRTNYTARVTSAAATVRFNVEAAMTCEHVGVQVRTTHTARGDLRITLVSPSGTRSVLQNLNDDVNAGPKDWIYWTTHHFFEPTKGEWVLEVRDLRENDLGTLTLAELMVEGVPVTDEDGDGMDDGWERRWFGGLDRGPRQDPGQHGLQLVREQCLAGDPMAPGHPFPRTLQLLDNAFVRVTFPTVIGWGYRLEFSNELGGASAVQTNSPGRVGEVELMVPYEARDERWYKVIPTPP